MQNRIIWSMRTSSAALCLPHNAFRNILADMPDSPEDVDLEEDEEGEDEDAAYAARRFVLDPSELTLQTFSQIAEYRNALKLAHVTTKGGKSKRLRKAWSRKSLAERVLRKAARAMRKEVAPVQQEFGPFPTIDLDKAGEEKERARFREAMASYVRKMLPKGKK